MTMADVAVVRKRVRTAIEQARRDQAERRERVAEAQTNYETFLQTAAIPVFRMIANVLKSEGNLNFEVMTPAGGVRLQSERNREDAINLELDTTADPPQPLVTDHARARQPGDPERSQHQGQQSSRAAHGRRRHRDVARRAPAVAAISTIQIRIRIADQLLTSDVED